MRNCCIPRSLWASSNIPRQGFRGNDRVIGLLTQAPGLVCQPGDPRWMKGFRPTIAFEIADRRALERGAHVAEEISCRPTLDSPFIHHVSVDRALRPVGAGAQPHPAEVDTQGVEDALIVEAGVLTLTELSTEAFQPELFKEREVGGIHHARGSPHEVDRQAVCLLMIEGG